MTDKNLLVITPHRKEPGKQRIAAYCRVSSRSDEQLNSLTNQINFYRSLFENDDTVVFVGIYAEEGLSGTQAESRPQFMKMIEDCRSGLIDCIRTKAYPGSEGTLWIRLFTPESFGPWALMFSSRKRTSTPPNPLGNSCSR
nr:MAG TPA: integrase [Caudoviricetes sp.]